ncbi:MAG TPA: ribose-5-phosphate isomerase RpiA [Caulobacteraceae bacterium]|nr:ribose-5-phosphate isomerase RpiA [Caulobacteraceae bacterium]
MSDVELQKKRSGEAAAALVQDGMTVGLGTGTTAAYLVKALGERAWAEGLKLRCVATSEATASLAAAVGLTVIDLNDAGGIDLTIDGADEIGPGLSLIKGGGAALLREKLVWEASKRCVVIADAAKAVPRLGKFPLPIEVVAFGHKTTALRLCDALAEADIGIAPRLRVKDGKPVVTDGGNYIYDAACGVIADPALLADALKSVTGVVEHGLFLDLAEEAILGTDSGVERLLP